MVLRSATVPLDLLRHRPAPAFQNLSTPQEVEEARVWANNLRLTGPAMTDDILLTLVLNGSSPRTCEGWAAGVTHGFFHKTWDHFLVFVDQYCVTPDAVHQQRSRLHELRQNKLTITEYVTNFQSNARGLNWSQSDLIAHFTTGLSTRLFVALHSFRTTNFFTFVHEALRRGKVIEAVPEHEHAIPLHDLLPSPPPSPSPATSHLHLHLPAYRPTPPTPSPKPRRSSPPPGETVCNISDLAPEPRYSTPPTHGPTNPRADRSNATSWVTTATDPASSVTGHQAFRSLCGRDQTRTRAEAWARQPRSPTLAPPWTPRMAPTRQPHLPFFTNLGAPRTTNTADRPRSLREQPTSDLPSSPPLTATNPPDPSTPPTTIVVGPTTPPEHPNPDLPSSPTLTTTTPSDPGQPLPTIDASPATPTILETANPVNLLAGPTVPTPALQAPVPEADLVAPLQATPATPLPHYVPRPRTTLLKLVGTLEGKTAVFLVDSGATNCYIARDFVEHHQLRTRHKETAQVVRLADGTLQACGLQVPRAAMHIQDYQDSSWTLTVLDLQGFDVVLGKSWLDQLGPIVDWRHNTMSILHDGKDLILSSPAAFPSRARPRVVLKPRPITCRPQRHCLLPPTLIDIKSFAELASRDPESCCVIHLIPVDPPSTPEHQGRVVLDVQRVIAEFPSVTAGLPSSLPPLREINHAIPLIPNFRIPTGRIYPVSTQQEAELKTQITDLLERGFIWPSSSPYGAPVLFVRKSDGTSRMCQDYRGLNKISIKNSYPLPRIDQLLDRLHGARVFSKLDLQMGYNQIRLEPQDVPKSAFRTRYGLYEYLVMPFGMCNAPATFQRTMNDIFRDCLDIFVLVYLDDILIYSKTPAEHTQHLRTVLGILEKHRFFCKLSKCQFGRDSMDFLGHHVGAHGIQAAAAKHLAIREWPVPTSPTDVRSFLGLANYVRRGVQGFSSLAVPLLELTHLNHKWAWEERHQKAFVALQDACLNSTVVQAPNPAEPFIVTTDASAYATGAILEQEYGGKRYVIAFDSRKFSGAEQNKTAYEKEMMAVLQALRTWRHHLLGPRSFVLNCDNSAVTFLSNQPQLTPQQARWQQTLSEYNYEIKHISGKTNVAADALSRRRDHA